MANSWSKAATLPIPTDVPLKQSKDYKIVGQRLRDVDSPAKVKGEAIFGIDFRMPGMKFARAVALPLHRRKVASFDDKESKKISGVSYVGKIADTAVAVVADSVWGAMEGRRVLNVTVGRWSEQRFKHCGGDGVAEARRIEKRREHILGRRCPESQRPPHFG